MPAHILLIAPCVRDDAGITTRVRRYEQHLTALGATVVSRTAAQVEGATLQWASHLHILSPLRILPHSVVETIMAQVPYSLTLTEYRVLSTGTDQRERWEQWASWLQGAQCVIVPSERVRTELIGLYGLHPDRVVAAAQEVAAIPDAPADAQEHITRRLDAAITGLGPVAVFAGGLREGRGLRCMLDVMSVLHHQGLALQVVIAGPVEETQFARALLPRCGAHRVSYIGAIDRSEMPLLLARATFVWQPGIELDVSASIVEAMTLAIPTVVHAHTLHWSGLDGDAAIAFTEPADIANILRDPRRLAHVGQTGYRLSQRRCAQRAEVRALSIVLNTSVSQGELLQFVD